MGVYLLGLIWCVLPRVLWGRCELISQNTQDSRFQVLQTFIKHMDTGESLPDHLIHPLIQQRRPPKDLVRDSYDFFKWPKKSLKTFLSEWYRLSGDGSVEWVKTGELCGTQWHVFPVYGPKDLDVVLFEGVDAQGIRYWMPTLWVHEPFQIVAHSVHRWSYEKWSPWVIEDFWNRSQTDLMKYLLSRLHHAFHVASPYVRFAKQYEASLPSTWSEFQEVIPEGQLISLGLEFDHRVLVSIRWSLPLKKISDTLLSSEMILPARDLIARCQRLATLMSLKDISLTQWFPHGLRCHFEAQGEGLMARIRDASHSAVLVKW